MANKVILGGILFTPGPRQKIQFSNPRSIAKVDIPGNAPGYQDMGPDETVLNWSGVLAGDDAYEKAIKIEALKNAGMPVQLIVSGFEALDKQVRIRTFPWDLVRKNRVEYTIELIEEIIPPPINAVITTTNTETESTATAGTEGQTYVIKQGDTLWDLATKYLGDGTRWREIADLNGIADPKTLQIGQSISIPAE